MCQRVLIVPSGKYDFQEVISHVDTRLRFSDILLEYKGFVTVQFSPQCVYFTEEK